MIYDLAIIGGGPAGYVAAERAGGAGMNVLLIEKMFLGGVCLNEGCIPTKTLLHSAKIFDNAKNGAKYGVYTGDIKLDHNAVIARKNKVVKTLAAGIRATLKKNNADIVEGFGEIAGRGDGGYLVKAGDSLFTAKRLLVATGSVPVVPPIPGLKQGMEQGFVLTSREILDIDTVPRSLVIVGGGVIGLEMASYFNSAGSKVVVVEMLDHVAGNIDRDISDILKKSYEKKGVEFRLNARVSGIREGSVLCEYKNGIEEIAADKVLLCIGRRPAIEGIGLERIGVETESGRINVDETGRTNVPGVYAAGDVNGRSMLAHTAYREAEACVNNMLGKKDIVRYNVIPSVIYTNPEAACVGETEETARQKGIDCETVSLSMRYSGRYVAENEESGGICKIIVDRRRRNLLGVHMAGNYSSEIIYGASLMMETEMKVDDIRKLVFPHPTVSEILREGAFACGI
ncbi:MAG: dihydrolipoyl dehydrogenase [Bacillota bacterium]